MRLNKTTSNQYLNKLHIKTLKFFKFIIFYPAFSLILTYNSLAKEISPLMEYIYNQDVEAVKFFTKHSNKNTINHQTSGGITPLHVAVRMGNIEIIKALLENKANPRIADNEGYTPLMKSIIFKKDPAFEILSTKNKDFFLTNKDKKHAIDYMVRHKCLKCLDHVFNYLKENETIVKNDKEKYLGLIKKYSFISNKKFLAIKNKLTEITNYVKNKNLEIEQNKIIIKNKAIKPIIKNKAIKPIIKKNFVKAKIKKEKKPIKKTKIKLIHTDNNKKKTVINVIKKNTDALKSELFLDVFDKKHLKQPIKSANLKTLKLEKDLKIEKKNKKKLKLKKTIKKPQHQLKSTISLKKSKEKTIKKPQHQLKSTISLKKSKEKTIKKSKNPIIKNNNKPKNDFFEEINDSYDNGQLKWY